MRRKSDFLLDNDISESSRLCIVEIYLLCKQKDKIKFVDSFYVYLRVCTNFLKVTTLLEFSSISAAKN